MAWHSDSPLWGAATDVADALRAIETVASKRKLTDVELAAKTRVSTLNLLLTKTVPEETNVLLDATAQALQDIGECNFGEAAEKLENARKIFAQENVTLDFGEG
jgi:hypothetical protein